MTWVIAGMMFAFFSSVTMLINQKFQINGHLISGMRGLGVALLFVPVLFFMRAPTSPLFWGLIVAQGLLSSFFNARLYASSAKFGAGATSRISAMAVVAGVAAWWAVDFNRLEELLADFHVFAGIMGSLAVIVVSFFFMSRSSGQNSRAGLIYMLPAVAVLAVMMIVRKEIMLESEFLNGIAYYCAFSIGMSGFWNLAYFAWKNSAGGLVREITAKHVMIGGSAMICASACTIICGNVAVYYAPNPAYVNALTLTSPIFVMAYNRLKGISDPVSIPAMAATLAGIAALLYFCDIPLPHPIP